ncbi:MAG: RNA 2',3'-cyclic phosphodiesterase [Bacteroides sp.]|jgi:2'-5' RNA ligase|nr:RNA 2',3'-cyclic phosphodiesterase [Bacteroides sp.]
MRRLFCAVKVPLNEALEEAIEAFRLELNDAQVSWVSTQNLHLTLKFFGDTPNQQVESIIEALHLSAASFPPFIFSVEGCGTFGSNRQPNVIWLGIRQGKQLEALYHSVNQFLAPLGYEPDRKLFIPHLTIGRIKFIRDTVGLRALESELKGQEFAKVRTGSFYLMESFLRPQGPLYKVVEEFKLGEGHRA